MDTFNDFLEMHGPGDECRPIRPDAAERYKGRLPDDLLQFWKEQGLCAYANRLIWFVDPDDFRDVLEEWLPPNHEYIAFGRTAFGDMFLSGPQGISQLVVHSGEVLTASPRLDLFVQISLTDKDYLNSALFKRVYDKVVKRLGPPAADECFAFVPALALGGPGTAETVQKVKLKEHLSILAQMIK